MSFLPAAARARLRTGGVFLSALALLLGPPFTDTLAAQQPAARDALRLADVYAQVAARNPRTAAAAALATAAEARVPSAGLPPDPQLQLGWMNYSLPSLSPMAPLGMTQLQVMQMVPLAGKLGLNRGIAAARAQADRWRASDAGWEARTDASMAFYDIYQTDEALRVMRETLRLLGDIASIAETMYRVGEGRQTDVLRARVEIARMVEDTLRMTAMRTAMAARLNAILDRPAADVVPHPAMPAFPAQPPSLAALDSAAVRSRPMIQAGAQDLAAADRMTRLARRELIPDLTVGVQYGQRGSSGLGADGMATTGTERMGSLMLGASVPVFARSRQYKLREEADAMRAMARADLAAMQADTRGRLAESYANLVRARNLIALYRTTILPQAEATVASALAAYRVGQVDFMTLLDNRMTVNRFRQELAVLEADEGKAWAELEMLTGTDLGISGSVPQTTPASTPPSRTTPGAATNPPSPATPAIPATGRGTP
ncbi:MAG: TolC family protein [Gemmatimonadaceae bacterium]